MDFNLNNNDINNNLKDIQSLVEQESKKEIQNSNLSAKVTKWITKYLNSQDKKALCDNTPLADCIISDDNTYFHQIQNSLNRLKKTISKQNNHQKNKTKKGSWFNKLIQLKNSKKTNESLEQAVTDELDQILDDKILTNVATKEAAEEINCPIYGHFRQSEHSRQNGVSSPEDPPVFCHEEETLD